MLLLAHGCIPGSKGWGDTSKYIPTSPKQGVGAAALQKALDWMLKIKKKKLKNTVICYKNRIWSKTEEMQPHSEMQR